jgi:lysophospholipase L1-like esterase
MTRAIKFAQCLTVLLLIAGCGSDDQLKPLNEDAVVLAFGDSITHGTGASLEQAYPARLQNMLSRTVINAGVPGEISKKGLKRLPGLLKRHRPALLILCHGGNDILRRINPKQTKENLQQMIDLARLNNTEVALIGVPQFGIFLTAAPFYEELAHTNALPLENDLLTDILRKNDLKSDQIHPNSKGYKVMAERIHTLLEQSGAI